MATASPEEVVQAFYRAFNNGDIETIVTLYEPRAMLVAQPGRMSNSHASASLFFGKPFDLHRPSVASP